jgi:glycosyltransferase involved in cell wall biosynthesis
MKIVIIGTAYPLRGGIAHYNALLANQLSKHHTVETITFKRQYPRLLFPGKTQQESGEPHHTTPAPQLLDSINPFNWFRVAKEIRARAPDLLIFKYWLPFFGLCFGTIAKMVKRGTHAKALLICDNVIPHERRPGDVVLTKYLFKHADFFIVQSDTVERDLNAMWPKARYKKVPHPVYELFGRAIDKQEARSILGLQAANILLFFGYIRPYKGLHILIDAMSKLVDKLDVRLVVVGEFYDDEKKYRNQIRELRLDSHVTINGDYVPNEKVRIYFSAADVVALPYVSATQSGIAQIAYNFDRPVIATDVGGLREVVRDNNTGFLVPANDSDALARSIFRFFTEKKEAEFTANVQKEKQKYTWDAMEEAIEKLCEE